MTAHVMIDIETLSTQPTATVLTIGAAAFHPSEPDVVLDSIDIRIDQNHPDTPKRHVSEDTLAWWKKQSDGAKESLTGGTLSLNEALAHLSDFVVRARERDKSQKLCVWGNDPDFDMVILADCFRDSKTILCPWQFWESRSTRTMKMLAQDLLGINHKKHYTRNGTYHNAEDDAIYQAKMVADILARLHVAVSDK